MKKNFGYSTDFDKNTEKLFRSAIYLGQGNNGIVYELPEDKVIKIFLRKKVCDDEGAILFKSNGSKFFPKIYKKEDLYIIRQKVYGERLDYYIKKNGLSERLINNIYDLLIEFKKLKFKKKDTRCKDIYVDEKERVMIIDPKDAFKRRVDYPRHLMKGMNKIGVLDDFLEGISKIEKEKSTIWGIKFKQYCEKLK